MLNKMKITTKYRFGKLGTGNMHMPFWHDNGSRKQFHDVKSQQIGSQMEIILQLIPIKSCFPIRK